jgi:hypothetical protein
MLDPAADPPTLAIVIAGALLAGFTTGFAGFGTGLVASGLWFHALPAAWVPPLVALSSVAAQIVGLVAVRKSFDWKRTAPYVAGSLIGLPLGVAALAATSPLHIRTAVGAFLIAYALYQLLLPHTAGIAEWGGRAADAIVGAGGGFLGGFAGLSAPLPLVWLRLRGWESGTQRAIYQPFNLVVLGLASLGMALAGQITWPVLRIAILCLPATVAGAWLGARVYIGVSALTFQRVVLCLLLLSGCILIAQAIAL